MTKNTFFKLLTLLITFLLGVVLLFSVSNQVKPIILIIVVFTFVLFCSLLEDNNKKKNHKDGDNTSVDFLLRYLLTNRLHSSTIHRVLALDSLNGGPGDSPSFFKNNIWYTIRHNPGTRKSFSLYLSQVAKLVEKIGSVSSVLPNEVWSQQSRDLVRSVDYLDSLFKNDSISDVFASNWNKTFTQTERGKAVAVVNDILSEQTNTLKEVAEVLDKRCSDYRSVRQSEVSRNLDALRAEYMKGTLVESRIFSKHDDHSVSDTTEESSLSDIWE